MASNKRSDDGLDAAEVHRDAARADGPVRGGGQTERNRHLKGQVEPSQDWLTLAAGRYGTTQVLNENDGVERGGIWKASGILESA